MKAIKIAVTILIILTVAFLWFRWTYSDKWERILYPLEYKDLIGKASARYSIDPYLICGIIYVESKFDPFSESKVGATGLMQVMPGTGTWIAKKQGRAFDPNTLTNPEINIGMGCWYFNYLRSRYGDEKLALAAYNSGYKNVDRWLKEAGSGTVEDLVQKIPFQETREFIQRVQSARDMYKKIYPNEFPTSKPTSSTTKPRINRIIPLRENANLSVIRAKRAGYRTN